MFVPSVVRRAPQQALPPQLPKREFPNALRGAQDAVNVFSAYLAQRMEEESDPVKRNFRRIANLTEAIAEGKLDAYLHVLGDAINARYDKM